MGQMREKKVTVTRWLEEELLIIPGVKVMICDICGSVEENEKVENWISTLLRDVTRSTERKKRLVDGLLILPVSRNVPN